MLQETEHAQKKTTAREYEDLLALCLALNLCFRRASVFGAPSTKDEFARGAC